MDQGNDFRSDQQLVSELRSCVVMLMETLSEMERKMKHHEKRVAEVRKLFEVCNHQDEGL